VFEFNSLIDYVNEVLFNLIHFNHNANIKKEVFINQIYYTGVQSLWYVLFFSAIFSFSCCFIFFNFLKTGDLNIFGEFLVFLGVRDLSPILIGLILLLRSGTAITSEIGAMKCEREISHILTMGISPVSYLITPRIIGLMSCSFFLSIYFGLFFILFTMIFSYSFSGIPPYELFELVHHNVTGFDYLLLMLKSLFGGLIIGLICCYRGLQCKESITEIPQQNIYAVRYSLISLFFIHAIFLFVEALNSGLLRYLKYA
tara:strand:- start:3052 stop:3822 length:771 start_codon:yes stop_codon:yes gene_type:complete